MEKKKIKFKDNADGDDYHSAERQAKTLKRAIRKFSFFFPPFGGQFIKAGFDFLSGLFPFYHNIAKTFSIIV